MILHFLMRAAALTAGATLVLGGVAFPASADDEFGQHVRACAQTMGFDGGHNPGMHRGASGWSTDHGCD